MTSAEYQREWKQKQKAKGLCQRCNRQARPGMSMCVAHAAEAREACRRDRVLLRKYKAELAVRG